jgi:dihydrofolate synthase / folylpolyglutamate synthase
MPQRGSDVRFEHLSDWLNWQEGLHPNAIDLGLDRMRLVLQRLKFQAPTCPVITIAGTKGKGSCAAILDSLLRAGGYRTGVFSSPHLRRYNERIQINGEEISDASLCAAFERIDQARAEISLTYFEFNALAAYLCFASANVDVWILEVGLGGRLDAANVIDSDVAVVTSIGLDHTEWLGNDLDSIGREKAGICRPGRPLLFGSLDMPNSIAQVAHETGANLLRAGEDFAFEQRATSWHWRMGKHEYAALPLPALAGTVQVANASCALAALQMLQSRLSFTRAAIERGLLSVHLDGRFQRAERAGVEWILDVAHNALSAAVLAEQLSHLSTKRTLALFGVMADKDARSMIELLRNHITDWWPVDLDSPRALPSEQLMAQLQDSGVKTSGGSTNLQVALHTAQTQSAAGSYERVLVFGSFLIVGPALDYLALDYLDDD